VAVLSGRRKHVARLLFAAWRISAKHDRRVEGLGENMSLESVGLSTQEHTAYRALVSMGSVSAVEVEAATTLSVPAATRALAALARRGLVHRVPGRVTTYTAVEPASAVAPLIREREEELARAKAEVKELASAYRRIGHRQHPADLIEVVEGRDNIMALYRRLVASSTTRMRYFSRPPYFSDDPEDDVQQRQRMNEGIVFEVVYDADTLERPEGLAAVRRNVARGERARVTGKLPMEMMIVDDDRVLIPIDLTTLESAYLIGSSSLQVAMVALFETTWLHAVPFHAATAPHDSATGTPDRDQLLTLLAVGLSDRAIQRQLGLSPRTLQRRVQDLYAELGAETRFQAGVAARHRDWVRPAGEQ
jgi:sugar-specific transcriptional regulator TrmB